MSAHLSSPMSLRLVFLIWDGTPPYIDSLAGCSRECGASPGDELVNSLVNGSEDSGAFFGIAVPVDF